MLLDCSKLRTARGFRYERRYIFSYLTNFCPDTSFSPVNDSNRTKRTRCEKLFYFDQFTKLSTYTYICQHGYATQVTESRNITMIACVYQQQKGPWTTNRKWMKHVEEIRGARSTSEVRLGGGGGGEVSCSVLHLNRKKIITE
jgi:hypothetical protein